MSSPIKVKSTKKPRYLGSFSYIPPGQILQSFIRIWRNVFFIRETKIPTSIEILYCKYIHTVYQVLPRVFIAFYWVSNTSYDHMSLYQIIKLGISQGYINHFVPKTIKLRLNATKLIAMKFAILAHSRRHFKKSKPQFQTQTVKKSNNHIHRVITSHLQWQSRYQSQSHKSIIPFMWAYCP